MRFDRIALDLGKTYFFGSGISADLPGGVMAFLKSPLAGSLPDVQFLFAAAPLEATPYLPPFTRPYADSFGCRAVVLRPESRGRLDLGIPAGQARDRWFADSPLEQTGFELAVPP